ncbi:hypothetical protein TUM4261_26710 [Shewanella sp. c952]|nr:hypothetical protein TUM4261_26710 [Shewanella sp. c952]
MKMLGAFLYMDVFIPEVQDVLQGGLCLEHLCQYPWMGSAGIYTWPQMFHSFIGIPSLTHRDVGNA